MKNLLIVLVILLSCSKKETANVNFYQITVRYTGEQDAPSPIIILKNKKPSENVFPVSNYRIRNEDLKKIKQICDSNERIKKDAHPLILVEVNKDSNIEKYLFNKKNGLEILNEIDKITLHYKNKYLIDDVLYLKYLTEKN